MPGQRFVRSVPGHEGELDDAGAVGEGAVRGGGWICRTLTLCTRVTSRPEVTMASWVKIELARWRCPA